MLRIVLAIASRGGLKLGSIILMVALFTGSITAVRTLSASYSSNTPLVKQMARPVRLSVVMDVDGVNGTRVRVASIDIQGSTVIVAAPEKGGLGVWLSVTGLKRDSPALGSDQALVSGRLLPSVSGGTIEVSGLVLQVVGTVDTANRMIVVGHETFSRLGFNHETFIYINGGSQGAGNGGALKGLEEIGDEYRWVHAEAPSALSLIYGLSMEVHGLLNAVSLMLYVSLGLACLVQGYYSMREGQDTFMVFKAHRAGTKSMILSLCLLSVIVASISVLLGLSLGVIASSSASLGASLVIGVPYVKPAVSLILLLDLAVAFASSFLGLALGYARGYQGAMG